MFNIGDIIELTKDVLIYNKGLICQVVEIDEDNSNYGWVKVLNGDWLEEYPTDDILSKGGFYI